MTKNKIVSLDLESRAVSLKAQNKTFREIAFILSEESKQKISHSSVKRYFDSCEQAKVQAVEKSDKLQAKVAEAEINTLAEAMACIDELKKICKASQEEGDNRTAIQAIDKIYTGLDIVNKVLGKYKVSLPESNSGVNIMFYLPGNNRDEPKIVGAGHGSDDN
ncbi:hypothetical protein [Methanolobus sp. WCC5]|uniref:hypothetical protein n=1 Tax=Methanolobus sp. WCC5 TaxID=3125785 RepID=UPI0032518217